MSREGIITGSHTYFLTTQGHGGPPRMRDQLKTGPPPRRNEREKRYTPFTHPFILTRRIWKDGYGVQIIFDHLVGLKLPDIRLTGEEKPSPRKLFPTGDRTRGRCVAGTNATTWSTAVDQIVCLQENKLYYVNFFITWRDIIFCGNLISETKF